MEQVSRFREVYKREDNGRVRCTVCQVSLAAISKGKHNNGDSHIKQLKNAGILAPTEDDVCYCITCGRSFLLRLLVRHMGGGVHLKYHNEGKRSVDYSPNAAFSVS